MFTVPQKDLNKTQRNSENQNRSVPLPGVQSVVPGPFVTLAMVLYGS